MPIFKIINAKSMTAVQAWQVLCNSLVHGADSFVCIDVAYPLSH